MKHRIILFAVLGIFITSELLGQRRSARQRSARSEATELTQDQKDPLLEKYGFDSKAALADFLLGQSLSRSEKRLVETYKGGKELSGRQIRTLTALLDKHKGTQITAGEKKEEQTSARQRAARQRPERSARKSDRSARGREPAARERAERKRPESARSARSSARVSERSARTSERSPARSARAAARKRGGTEASARKSRYASARTRDASARTRGRSAREEKSAEGIEAILKGIDDGSIPEIDASEGKQSGRLQRGRTSARLAGQGQAEGTTSIENFDKIGRNLWLAASKRYMWGNRDQCAKKCLENEWCDAFYVFNKGGDPRWPVCVYADDVDPARQLPPYYQSWNFRAYQYADRTTESAKIARLSELDERVTEQTEVIAALSTSIEQVGPQIEKLEEMESFVEELEEAQAEKERIDQEERERRREERERQRSFSRLMDNLGIGNFFGRSFSFRRSGRSASGMVSAREVESGGDYPKFFEDIESGKLEEYGSVTQATSKSKSSGRRARSQRSARTSARTAGEGAVEGLTPMENFRFIGSNQFISSYRQYSWGDENSCAARCLANEWCDAFYTYTHPKYGDKVCVLNDDVDPVVNCRNNRCRSLGLNVYVHNEFADEDKRIADLTEEAQNNEQLIEELRPTLESYAATVQHYEERYAPFFEIRFGSTLREYEAEEGHPYEGLFERWTPMAEVYRAAIRAADRSASSANAGAGDLVAVRAFTEEMTELNARASETRRGIRSFNRVFTTVDNRVKDVNDFKTGVDALKATIDTGARLPKVKGAFIALQKPAEGAQNTIGTIQTNACRMNNMLDTPRALLKKGDDMLSQVEDKLTYISTMAPELYALLTLAINCGQERYSETNAGTELIAQLENTRDVYAEALYATADIVRTLNYTFEDMEYEARETKQEIRDILSSAPDFSLPASLDIIRDFDSELNRSVSLCPWPTASLVADLTSIVNRGGTAYLEIPGLVDDYTVGKKCPSGYTHVGGGTCRKCRGGVPEGPCWLQGDCTYYCEEWACFGYECKGTYPSKSTSCPSNSCDAVVGCIKLKSTVSIRDMLTFADDVIEEIKDQDPTGLIDEVDGLIDDAVATIVSELGVGSVFNGLVPSWSIYSEDELNTMIATYEGYLNNVNSQLDNLIEEMRTSLRQITEQIGTDAYNAMLADYMCPSVEEKLTIMAEAFVDDAFSQFSSEVLAQAAEDRLQAAWLGSRLGQKTTEMQGKVDELEAAYQDPFNTALSHYLAQFSDNSGCPGPATASAGDGGQE